MSYNKNEPNNRRKSSIYALSYETTYFFFGEAMKILIYLINHFPSVPLEGDILKNVWLKKNVYEHLRVFGYRTFGHISKYERSKLDSKSRQCIFLDYVDEQLGIGYEIQLQRK